jgi:hypothetical protein
VNSRQYGERRLPRAFIFGTFTTVALLVSAAPPATQEGTLKVASGQRGNWNAAVYVRCWGR